ncbi:potassium channel [Metarhizium album ARSEF 1941]|uniref:Potassium channel n=1 Tax=Metarhizium album (strain ARSEF 1941) TaxID=1081103 RepID=A0A0B2WSG5_METAS|nr:potassium channel [Metarhizium album ARSEF 1941]KHN99016.1 potassium channel [Metarhizium album ARSEF 1941]
MVAATLGPVASGFSICALGSQWRQKLVPGQSVDDAIFIQDPPWLTIVNAIQLAVALVSNAFLLLNMTKRVRFSIAQPITIIGWYISAICLLALNATAAGPLDDDLDLTQDFIWSQAFYYGMWAAILYFVDASLMVVTFWGASSGHYPKDFNLTRSQRTLMLQTILFLMYLLLGALVFSELESWRYLDAVYWADVTLFTVGFGDLAPKTTLGCALLIPYALIGVISLGLVISSIRSMILERGRRRLDARMEEKNRRRFIRTMTKSGRDDILNPIDDDTISNWGPENSDLPQNELDRRKTEFLLMRKIQQQASIRRKWMAMAVSTGVWILLWLVGAVIFVRAEKSYQSWNYFDGVYFCFISLMTIGYGDHTPTSNAGKSFFVFWSLLALPTMTVLISNAGDTVVKFVKDATIRIGTITILPGEEGFTGNAKYIVNRVSLGRLFRSATIAIREHERERRMHKKAEDWTGFDPKDVKDTEKQQNESGHSGGSGSQEHQADDEERQGKHKLCKKTESPPGRPSLAEVQSRLDTLPTGAELHLLLVKEIQTVSQHLREPEPRRYTFEEWAWFLALIGEDERDPLNHRRVVPKTKHKRTRRHRHKHHNRHRGKGVEAHDVPRDADAETIGAPRPSLQPVAPLQLPDADARVKWSWVGNRSPLMGGQEESEWILDKLMERLEECLWETKMDEDNANTP